MKRVSMLTVLLLVTLLVLPGLIVNAESNNKNDVAALESRIVHLEKIIDELSARIETIEKSLSISNATTDKEVDPSELVESILSISNVKITEKYSALNLTITVKNDSKDKSVDAYDMVAYAYDTYGENVKYMSNEFATLTSSEVIKPGKTSPKGFYWALYNMSSTKTMKVAIVKYHTTEGDTIEIPEDQYVWFEYTRE